MTYEKTYDVLNNDRLIIQLPEKFRSKKRVRVIIEDVDDARPDKIELMKKAVDDPLFLSDIEEVQSDFADADTEI